ncbi:MAG: efflux RND transporter permease subunit, partial [Phycisphaerae bacterium]|nr:efflux RND transporter permease subunit [Phycisphaerae bacterium]
MATSVATPMERQFSTIAGIDAMTSTNTQGITQISLQFSLGRNIDAAAQDVQAAIAKVQPLLPREMTTPPSYQKVNPADQPILYIALTSDSLPMSKLHDAGYTIMAQQIGTVSGVAQVQVLGGKKYAVRIQLDPKAMASRGLGIDEVQRAIASANVNQPTGVLYGEHQARTVQPEGQIRKAPDYMSLVVAYRSGAPVYLRDIGTAVDSVEQDKVAAWYCDRDHEQQSIVLGVQRQPGTNTVAVASAVKERLEQIKQQLPAAVEVNMLYDRSESIRESVDDVNFTLKLTLALVVMVIFLFIRNVSATVIPSLALPMSVIGTFALMYVFGYSLDNLSLMALTLSVGFVVDDAIVMLENIVRHYDMGKTRMQAALDGAKEVSFTILSMTLSLAAVFIPVLFMGGVIGRLFRSFSVTIGCAVIVSGFVSLTLTPMLCSRFLRAGHAVHHGVIYRITEAGFNAMLWFYELTLRFTLRHRIATLLVAAATLAGTVKLFQLVPKAFSPSEDRGIIFCQTECDQGVSYKDMIAHQRAFNTIVRQNPNVEAFMSLAPTGGMGFGGSNAGISFVRLVPKKDRVGGKTPDQIIDDLRPPLSQIPGINVYMQNPPTLMMSGKLTKAKFQYTLQGAHTDDLYRATGEMVRRLKAEPGFIDVNSDLQLKSPQIYIPINRDQATKLGVSAAQIESALYLAYGSSQISTIYEATDQYSVIMELQSQFQHDKSALSQLYVRSSMGKLISLDVLTQKFDRLGPLSINHYGQLPAVTLSYNLEGLAEGAAADRIAEISRDVLPETVSGFPVGQSQEFQKSMGNLLMLFIMAIVVIYIVLGILYESFLHPITILSAIPLASFGALLTLLAFNVELSIYSFVGLILLVGLVKKNGIMMVDFAVEGRRQGKNARDAIYDACVVRFRPIMMTTVAALAGAAPIAVGFGAGGEVR